MSPLSFDDFFRNATGNPPYHYQRRLACGEQNGRAKTECLATGTTCQSQLINIPTGLGKTAAVVLAWLWNRIHPQNPEWPRRLVYCLPMRTLVEQTQAEVSKWIGNLLSAIETGKLVLSEAAIEQLRWLKDHSPVILMGGEDATDWDIYPEKPAILIGTQDMLLSRALNRGYGMARARWPMHFGLLNNDALWVLDETQLMGVGVRTSAQLQGLRQRIGTALGCATWWASATLDSRLLITPDHPDLPPTLKLETEDRSSPKVDARINSVKRLTPLPFTLHADSSKAVAPYIEAFAEAVVSKHQIGTLTLVILNRVDRAKDLYAALDKLAKKQSIPERVLVHSRFRPIEREELAARIKATGEKILIATQAIEAGVDISARTLMTELAPWSSLVQRFGRCNRKGEFNKTDGADIFWINLEADDPKNADSLALPYSAEQLATARNLLRQAESPGASPSALEKFHADEPLAESHLLRRKDLVDLFDTTPDLSGLDLDVGRYIRDDEERDVQVFWREMPKEAKAPDDTIVPDRRELVRVAAHVFKKFAEKNKGSIWRRDPLEGAWEEFRDTYYVAPGQIFLVDVACGGYSVTLGWTGEKSKESFPVLNNDDPPQLTQPRDGQGNDDESQIRFQTLAKHTAAVVAACTTKLDAFPSAITASWRVALLTAARWHDIGKAHPVFQKFLTDQREVPGEYQSQLLAKSEWKPGVRFERPHFRHELASALAWLQAGEATDETQRNLVAFLIATHHGKVRLSLRAMPEEAVPSADELGQVPPFARGVWHGDKIPDNGYPQLNIDGIPTARFPLKLDLFPMLLGEANGKPSWSARMIALRDATDLGLFRLAWLETLLRAGDAEGSNRI
ncbi:MAG TPA: CRISPR-associated endonuclease Cas3'' [Verrucomicrobiae bacterium]|nr:CRISPR-associated endonuclease Cas3'' [Verrucomicrobiae bacterium]